MRDRRVMRLYIYRQAHEDDIGFARPCNAATADQSTRVTKQDDLQHHRRRIRRRATMIVVVPIIKRR